jgi:hypothetical protein
MESSASQQLLIHKDPQHKTADKVVFAAVSTSRL